MGGLNFRGIIAACRQPDLHSKRFDRPHQGGRWVKVNNACILRSTASCDAPGKRATAGELGMLIGTFCSGMIPTSSISWPSAMPAAGAARRRARSTPP